MRFRFLLCTVTLAPLLAHEALAQRDSRAFEQVFGMSRVLPAAQVERVLALEPGERLTVDTDNDGLADTLWYLDAAPRHTVSPLVVMVKDEDGDLETLGRGDRDSDCYFWDHGGDGFIDAVTDYQDDDGDGDVDQMGIFFDKNWDDAYDDLTVWWAFDIGDDNRLWFDVNGTYYQHLCQWRTHFSGDESFYQFRLRAGETRWLNVFEDPFAFYDVDGDDRSEMVIRICAVGHDVESLRYSIDADDDARGARTHNYDFSVTALPPVSGLRTPEALTETFTIRGMPTHPALRWADTPAFAQEAAWGKALLVWDAINSNTDGDPNRDPQERWEGLLNHATKTGDFPQVGGPACSPLNKRFEMSATPEAPLSLYFSPEDQRFHLQGADYGYLDVDYNLDGTIDARYTWADTDEDGILDRRRADVDADGAWDFTHALTTDDRRYALTFEEIAPAYTATLDTVLPASQRFIDTATAILGGMPAGARAVADFFSGPLRDYHRETELGIYIRESNAGARFYVDLVRDRLFVALAEARGNDAGWQAVHQAYLAGEFAAAADALQAGAPAARTRALEHDGHRYTRRIPIEVTGRLGRAQDNWPITIDVAALRAAAPDFNPRHCRIVDGAHWLSWRVLPHQVDDWATGDAEQLSFLADIPATGTATWYLYYEPEGASSPAFQPLTQAVLDTPAYVAWESDAGAYRFYTGQFDYFGKHVWRTLPRTERLIYPLVDVDYHREQPWGIDALKVGATSGLGGVTLLDGDLSYPVQAPAGEGDAQFRYRVLGSGPVRATVEAVATHVLPGAPEAEVVLRAFIYAKRAESMVEVQLPPAHKGLAVAPGLLHVSEAGVRTIPGAGVMADWGWHGDEIGEIGVGVVVPPAQVRSVVRNASEARLVCAPADGHTQLRYWILGDWRRGMQYPVSPGPDEWLAQLETLAHALNTSPDIHIGAAAYAQ